MRCIENYGVNMALIKCVECGKLIISSVKTCPHCGKKEPIISLRYKIVAILAFVTIITLSLSYVTESDESAFQPLSAERLDRSKISADEEELPEKS
jgi:uncharacterized OB-fold protein